MAANEKVTAVQQKASEEEKEAMNNLAELIDNFCIHDSDYSQEAFIDSTIYWFSILRKTKYFE